MQTSSDASLSMETSRRDIATAATFVCFIAKTALFVCCIAIAAILVCFVAKAAIGETRLGNLSLGGGVLSY